MTDELDNLSREEAIAGIRALHAWRDKDYEDKLGRMISSSRKAVADMFVRGSGLELGAGSRPYPIPDGTQCYYGDVRDREEIEVYFKDGRDFPHNGILDAQTLAGIANRSVDFVISAHVIEHLENPIGSIVNQARVLKPGGVVILTAPDRRHTFDRRRPTGTPLDHLIEDAQFGGSSTRLESYIDHLRYVGPEMGHAATPDDELLDTAKRISDEKLDIHFHAWSPNEFRELLNYCTDICPIELVGGTEVVNEHTWVLRKLQ